MVQSYASTSSIRRRTSSSYSPSLLKSPPGLGTMNSPHLLGVPREEAELTPDTRIRYIGSTSGAHTRYSDPSASLVRDYEPIITGPFGDEQFSDRIWSTKDSSPAILGPRFQREILLDQSHLSTVYLTPQPDRDGPQHTSTSEVISQDASEKSKMSLFPFTIPPIRLPRLPTTDYLKTITLPKLGQQKEQNPSHALKSHSLTMPDIRMPRLPTMEYLRNISLPDSLKFGGQKVPNEAISVDHMANNLAVEPSIEPKLAISQVSNPYLAENLAKPQRNISSRETTLSVPQTVFGVPMTSSSTNFTSKFPIPTSNTSVTFSQDSKGAENGNIVQVYDTSVGSWTAHKWVLVISVCLMFVYGMGGLLGVIAIWFQAIPRSAVMSTVDNDIMVLITLASTMLILASIVGLSGTLLNSRPILAFYTLLLWPCFLSMLTIGYTSYKRSTFALDRKLNEKWSQALDSGARLIIQEVLHCCGFYNPLHDATLSTKCYSRSPLPGCKGKLYHFEKANLTSLYTYVFCLVPVHIVNIFVALLCSNHVNKIFGKGLTPKQYRLTAADIQAHCTSLASMALPTEESATSQSRGEHAQALGRCR